MFRQGVFGLAVLLAAVPVLGDEVLFNNGDRITGTIVGIEGGKMTINSKLAGEIKVDMKEVKTFTTDAPIDLRTNDGQKINQKASAADAGTVKVDSTVVPLANVKRANPNEKWNGAVIAGALFSRGNTDTDSVNIAFDLNRRWEKDELNFEGAYYFGRQRDPDSGDKTTNTDNWYLFGQWDHYYSEKLYFYANTRYAHDRIADLDYRLTPGVGLGYNWIEKPDLTFSTEAGVSYVCEQSEDGTSNDFIAARLAYHVEKKLWTDVVSLFHNLEYYPSFERADDYLVLADAGIRAAITKEFFAEYKIEWRYDATPAEGNEKNDLRHIVGVGYKF